MLSLLLGLLNFVYEIWFLLNTLFNLLKENFLKCLSIYWLLGFVTVC